MKICRTMALLPLLLFGQAALAGPFGTQMGDQPEKFGEMQRANNLYYQTLNVPKPHSRIGNYLLGFTDSGLARVIGYTEFEADPSGARGASLFQSLQKALIRKYGQPAATAGRQPGSAWTRGLATWDKNLPDNIRRITLSFYSEDGVKSRVDVFYVYNNNPSPEEWDKLDEEAL